MERRKNNPNKDYLKELCEICPTIFEMILFNLDTKTIVKCTEVSKYFLEFICEESKPIQKDIYFWKKYIENSQNTENSLQKFKRSEKEAERIFDELLKVYRLESIRVKNSHNKQTKQQIEDLKKSQPVLVLNDFQNLKMREIELKRYEYINWYQQQKIKKDYNAYLLAAKASLKLHEINRNRHQQYMQ